MATSGTTTYSVTRDTLIKDALIDIGAVSQEDTVSSSINDHAARLLNMMIKAWMADGLHLWKIKPFTILTENGKRTYNLGLTGDQASFSMNATTLAANAASSATSLTVTSATNITIGDNIGIALNDNTLHKTTITNIVGTTITITAGLASAASSGNRVYNYTTKIPRPMMVDNATIKDSSNFSRPVMILSREEYYALANKYASGSIVQLYFDPQRTNSVLYVYNVPNTVDKTIELTGYFPMEDMNSASNDFDIPQEWYLAIKTNLALLLAPSYGVRSESLQMIAAIAKEEKERVMGWDKEQTSLYFGVDSRYK